MAWVAWSKLPRSALGILLTGLRPGKRQAWTPLTTEGSGLSAWSKLPRSVLGILRVLRPGKRQAWTPLTTEDCGLSAWSKLPRSALGILRVLRPGKRQAWTPLTTEGCGPECLVHSMQFSPPGGLLPAGLRVHLEGIVVWGGLWCLCLRGSECQNGGGGFGMPLLPWQATKEPSSTPPVVPGAAPALAKAGVGGYRFF